MSNIKVTKLISIQKTEKDKKKELNRFIYYIKSKNLNIEDISKNEIHYIFIFSNIYILKYLSKKIDLFIDNEEYARNIEVMSMSEHWEQIDWFLNEYYNKQSNHDRLKIKELLLNKIFKTGKYELFEFLINKMSFEKILKDENKSKRYLKEILDLPYYKNRYQSFMNNFFSINKSTRTLILEKNINFENKIILNKYNKLKLRNMRYNSILYLLIKLKILDNKDKYKKKVFYQQFKKNKEMFFELFFKIKI